MKYIYLVCRYKLSYVHACITVCVGELYNFFKRSAFRKWSTNGIVFIISYDKYIVYDYSL